MLTEQLIASISTPHKTVNASATKDAGIFIHELQPHAAQRTVFKKSASPANCLAVSATHVFAAQEEKAVVHVYNRERNNQEATVPFPEKIQCICLAANDTVLVLGTESGRVMVWETCTGRSLVAAQSHIQAVTCLAVDRRSHFLLTGSKDANVLVWSLTTLLSISSNSNDRKPIHHLDIHRSAVTALVVGHGASAANITVSASEETAHVWDYQAGIHLRTIMIPSAPLAMALDPADRALYVAYADGSLQTIDFFARNPSSTTGEAQDGHLNPIHDKGRSSRPIYPPQSSVVSAPSQNLGSALSLAVSWDGTTLISGHESGKIVTWDVARGSYSSTLTTLPGSVTNLQLLPPIGFPSAPQPKLKLHNIVKPKVAVGGAANTTVPKDYTFTAQFVSQLKPPTFSATEPSIRSNNSSSTFDTALTYPGFPSDLLDQGIAELATWNQPSSTFPAATSTNGTSINARIDHDEDNFVPLNASEDQELRETALAERNAKLEEQLAALQRVQKVTFAQLVELRKERKMRRGWVGTSKSAGEIDVDVDGDEEMQD